MISPTVRLGTRAVVAVLASLVLWPLAASAAVGVPAAPACAPQQRNGAVTSLRLDETQVSAYQDIQVFFQGQLPANACPGDTVRIDIPRLMRIHAGSYAVGDPENVPLGKLVVDPVKYTATITFNDYLRTHDNVRFFGRIGTSLSPVARPGARYDLVWGIGGKKLRTPLRANRCDDCDRPRTGAHAWSTLEGSTVYFALESAPSRVAGEAISFNAHVAPGQKVRCSTVSAHTARVGEWGQLVWDATVPALSVTCGPDRARYNKGGTYIEAQARSNRAGQYVVLSANSQVSDAALNRYNTFGQITQTGYRGNVVAAANRFDSGGGGSGLVPEPGPDASQGTGPTQGVPNEEKTSQEPVRNASSESGPDRGPILLAGLVTFIAGAIIVSLGLRRRA